MDLGAGPAAVEMKEARNFMLVLWKTIELLEHLKGAGTKDSRPRKIQSLRNVVHPLCKVIFFSDIANILRTIHNESKRQILIRQTTPPVSVSVSELQEKVCKGVLSKAQKQRRIIVMANDDPSTFSAIHKHMMRWKKLKLSNTRPHKELISTLVDACTLPVDLDGDHLIDMLSKAGLVHIDKAGKVNYALPDADRIKLASIGLKSNFDILWNRNKPSEYTINQDLLDFVCDNDSASGIDDLIFHAGLHLQKMDDHKPKTEKGLRNALKPMRSVLYIVSPYSILKALVSKGDRETVAPPRKRCWSFRNDDNAGSVNKERITFRTNARNKKNTVQLNEVIYTIGLALSGKQESKTSKLVHKENSGTTLHRLSDMEFCKNITAPVEKKEVGCPVHVLQKLLLYVQRKAQHLNKSVVFCTAESETLCANKMIQWLSDNSEVMSDGRDKDMSFSSMDVDIELQPDHMNAACSESGKPEHTFSQVHSHTVNAYSPKPLSDMEVLAALQSLSISEGELDPDFIIKLLSEAGYCSIQESLVTYPDKPGLSKEYQKSLMESFVQTIEVLYESFSRSKPPEPTVGKIGFRESTRGLGQRQVNRPYLKHLRKRPRYL